MASLKEIFLNYVGCILTIPLGKTIPIEREIFELVVAGKEEEAHVVYTAMVNAQKAEEERKRADDLRANLAAFEEHKRSFMSDKEKFCKQPLDEGCLGHFRKGYFGEVDRYNIVRRNLEDELTLNPLQRLFMLGCILADDIPEAADLYKELVDLHDALSTRPT